MSTITWSADALFAELTRRASEVQVRAVRPGHVVVRWNTPGGMMRVVERPTLTAALDAALDVVAQQRGRVVTA